MKILIIPDSFKGSASNVEVATWMEAAMLKSMPEAACKVMPMADGGEGSLDTLYTAIGGQWVFLESVDPLQRPIQSKYLRLENTAFIELALASGLHFVDAKDRSAGHGSTLGTGMLIRDAIAQDLDEIVLCIGGSATNDGGVGIAYSLGYRFENSQGQSFLPVGNSLHKIAKIISPEKPLKSKITVLCDVRNPFTGPIGATHTYGPQKGASHEEVAFIEKGMIHLRDIIKADFGLDLDLLEGAGAAGGVGGGMVVFAEAKLVRGIEYLLKKLNVDQEIRSSDLILTGEGRLDFQSQHGKLISGISEIAKTHAKPVVAICGGLELTTEETEALDLVAAFSILPGIFTLEEATQHVEKFIKEAVGQVANLIKKFSNA